MTPLLILSFFSAQIIIYIILVKNEFRNRKSKNSEYEKSKPAPNQSANKDYAMQRQSRAPKKARPPETEQIHGK